MVAARVAGDDGGGGARPVAGGGRGRRQTRSHGRGGLGSGVLEVEWGGAAGPVADVVRGSGGGNEGLGLGWLFAF